MTQYYYNPTNNSYYFAPTSNPYEFMVYPDFANGFYKETAYNVPVYKAINHVMQVSHLDKVVIKSFLIPMIPAYSKDAYFISINQYGQPQTYQYQLPLMEVPENKFHEMIDRNIENKEVGLIPEIAVAPTYNLFSDKVWTPPSESDDSSDDLWPDVIGDAAGA